jgi:hypothetical protein
VLNGEKSENLYCKIFVDVEATREAVVAMAAECCAGTVGKRTVIARHLELDVDDNDDFVPRAKRLDQDDFVRFRYFLDVEPTHDAERSLYIAEIGALLRCLWGKGLKAVAACDFEDKLPAAPTRGP